MAGMTYVYTCSNSECEAEVPCDETSEHFAVQGGHVEFDCPACGEHTHFTL